MVQGTQSQLKLISRGGKHRCRDLKNIFQVNYNILALNMRIMLIGLL